MGALGSRRGSGLRCDQLVDPLSAGCNVGPSSDQSAELDRHGWMWRPGTWCQIAVEAWAD